MSKKTSEILMKLLEEFSFDKKNDSQEKKKIVLLPGYSVTVRTKDGNLVVRGRVTEVDKDLGIARINDGFHIGGTDMQVDVNSDLYDIYVTHLI